MLIKGKSLFNKSKALWGPWVRTYSARPVVSGISVSNGLIAVMVSPI
jgi:hypothetical protein